MTLLLGVKLLTAVIINRLIVNRCTVDNRGEDRHQWFCGFHAAACVCQRTCTKFDGEGGVHQELV